MTSSRFSALVVAALLVAACNAISISWTGYAANGQWDTNTNWYPDQVPGPQDDVTLNSGSVVITTPVSVNSLGMGNSFSATANLTVLSSLTVFSTMTVEGNGNLLLTSGASLLSGTVNIEGGLVFSAGTLSGTVTVSKNGVANLGGAGQKAFSACGFTAASSVSASGVLLLSQSSSVSLTSVEAAGDLTLQAGDSSAVSLTASTLTYNGGGTLLVQMPVSLATFNFLGGNVTLIASATFGGAVSIPDGSTLRAVSTSTVAFEGGLFGEGVLHALGDSMTLSQSNFTGELIAEAGVVTLGAGSLGTVLANGATIAVNDTVSASSLLIVAGLLEGSGELVVESLSIATPGFNLNAAVVVTGTVTATKSVLAMPSAQGAIKVASGATMTVSGTVQVTDKGVFTNNGAVSVSGTLSFTGIQVGGAGTYAVSGSLSLTASTFGASAVQLTGTGSFSGQSSQLFPIAKISVDSTAAGVDATIGDYSLTCPGTSCTKVSSAGIATSRFNFQSA